VSGRVEELRIVEHERSWDGRTMFYIDAEWAGQEFPSLAVVNSYYTREDAAEVLAAIRLRDLPPEVRS
jgi:ribosomal protein L15E